MYLNIAPMNTPIDIECEIRAFLTDEEHASLLEKLRGTGISADEDEQVTYYFEGNGDPDLRIQRNSLGAKIWYKDGKMHEDSRREIEIACGGGDAFGRLEQLFVALGYRVSIKWLRKRRTFKLDDITVTLDDTKGYGKIVEFERVCREDEREKAVLDLKLKMRELGISPTPKDVFARRYEDYKKNWRNLLGEA